MKSELKKEMERRSKAKKPSKGFLFGDLWTPAPSHPLEQYSRIEDYELIIRPFPLMM